MRDALIVLLIVVIIVGVLGGIIAFIATLPSEQLGQLDQTVANIINQTSMH